MSFNSGESQHVQLSLKYFLIPGVILLCLTWLSYQSGLLQVWIEDEEYGHGLMVFAVLGYIIYKNHSELPCASNKLNWLGVVVAGFALIVFILGTVSGINPILMYSIWVFILGVILSVGSMQLAIKLIVPLGIVFLLIPLPNVLGPLLTSNLQLLSSVIGVWFIRLFGGIVFLEGNVIDMGSVKLLVAEACAGLRYLFPLLSISAIAGYVMKAPNWMRWLLFLAAIPITIIMNSFRIGVTGLLSENYGVEHTEGFLHFFEGWVVFVASIIVLVVIARLLIYLNNKESSFQSVFSLENIYGGVKSNQLDADSFKTVPVKVTVGLLIIAVISSSIFAQRELSTVERQEFSKFPSTIGQWSANKQKLPVSIVTAVDASDYYHAYYRGNDNKAVNLYMAYYVNQKLGAAPHSPTLCIPGDGWVIKNDTVTTLKSKQGKLVNVSRLLMIKGNKKMIAYYWIKQGEESFYQQFMARLNLIWFSIRHNRADAALLRMITEVFPGESEEDADKRLKGFASEYLDILNLYVPD